MQITVCSTCVALENNAMSHLFSESNCINLLNTTTLHLLLVKMLLNVILKTADLYMTGMGFEEVLIGDKTLAYFTLKQNLIYSTINR